MRKIRKKGRKLKASFGLVTVLWDWGAGSGVFYKKRLSFRTIVRKIIRHA
jgi:hypothetical protein